jgi:hypothetical protein
MHPIEKPELLDPDRIVDPNRGDITVDHESAAKELREALEASCEYGRQLWDHLGAVRQYLMASLPPDPRAAGPHTQLSAHPTGPDDSEGWQHWADIYASVTSVLAGPHGDSGYGFAEAREAARIRTEAPNARLAARLHDGKTGAASSSDSASQAAREVAATATRSVQESLSAGAIIRGIGVAALGVLALRGLRPRN